MAKQRNYTLDILRIIACINVILCHTAGSPIMAGYVTPGTLGYSICVFFTAITRWDIAIFVMLPGFFLIDPRKDLPIKVVLNKYIARVAGALIFWSLFYAVTLHKPIYPFGSQEDHFWYLGMVIGVYLSIPVLRQVALNAKLMRYFLIVWAGFIVYQFIGYFVPLPINVYTQIFVDFAGFALFAYYLRTVFANPTDPAKMRRISHVIYALGAIGLVVLLCVPVITQNDEHFVMNFTALNTFALVTAIFVFCIRHPLTLGPKMGNFISNMSQCTFGVYLVHVWILIQIFNRIHRFVPQTLPLILICVVVTFCVGMVISFFLRKIPFCRKYIV